jgi:hypothetical protein
MMAKVTVIVVVTVIGGGFALCQTQPKTGRVCTAQSDVQILTDPDHKEIADKVRDLLRGAGCVDAVVNDADHGTEKIDKVKFFNEGDRVVAVSILKRTDELLRHHGIHAETEDLIDWNKKHGNKAPTGHVELWLTKAETLH